MAHQEQPDVAQADTTELGLLDRISNVVHGGMERGFAALTGVVVEHPVKIALGVVLLSVACAQGIWRFESEDDASKLYVPADSRAVYEDEYVEATFGDDARRVNVYFISPSGAVLTPSAFSFMQRYHDALLQFSVDHDGRMLNFSGVCQKVSSTTCTKPRSPLTLWDHNMAAVSALTQPALTAAVNNETQWRESEPAGPPLQYYVSSEGLVKGADGAITQAKAVRMVVLLKNKRVGGKPDPETDAFESGLVDAFLGTWSGLAQAEGLEMELDTVKEREDAEESAIQDDVIFLSVGYGLLAVYACFVLGRSRAKFSHSTLGLVSVLSVGMSTISAYGVCWLIGLEFNGVVQTLILVLLGIGVDDTFVIMDSWWDNASILDMKERMIAAVKHAGPAITITSVTDLIAFLAGSSTRIPALRTFCYYATFGILFDFLYQVTFFVAVAYLDSERQKKGKRDGCCCISASDDDGCLGPCCVSRPSFKADAAKGPDTYSGAGGAAQYDEAQRGSLHHLIGVHLPRVSVGTVYGKVAVLAVSVLLLSLGIVGCLQVKMNFNNDWFVPDGARYKDVLDTRDYYFGGNTLPVGIYTKQVDYDTLEVQKRLEDQLRGLEGSRWVVSGSVSSWLRSFTQHTVETSPADTDNTTHAGYTLVRPDRFYPLLRAYIAPGVGPRQAGEFVEDLVWTTGRYAPAYGTENDARLIASRGGIFVVPGPLGDGQQAVDCMDDLRGILDPYESFPFHFVFLYWESYAIFVDEVTKNVAIAASCVVVLVTVLTASPLTGLVVLLAIGCVDVCLIGFMAHVGVEINSVSVICIVLAIGLAVDYSVHIAGAFLTVSADDLGWVESRSHRAAYAVWKMGPAVMNGAFSTFLAVLPLAVAKSYIFTVFFRMFAMIIAFGVWFGVFFLPVFLSLAGPAPTVTATRLKDVPNWNPLDEDFDKPPQVTTVAQV
eukprot:TRINITY_DN667_c1_g4_i2.p1 TRINITY_DN667_c1_g4~~TRINITY_DN667_c1_g4_i2.p1  ORF type:complete len:944 (+),score=355.52 TRINITY_DN667_c1_g4_i2:43-2874(+)